MITLGPDIGWTIWICWWSLMLNTAVIRLTGRNPLWAMAGWLMDQVSETLG